MSKEPGSVLLAGDDLLNITDHTARSECVGRSFSYYSRLSFRIDNPFGSA
ncbi:hypothetical protein F9U43_02810 [Pectobacterium versatile]|nr:hypothetical protein [Pectobacterium versatile]